MRVFLLLPAVIIISCSGSKENEKPMTWEDSVINHTNAKIEKLDKHADSIEHVNATGTRTLK